MLISKTDLPSNFFVGSDQRSEHPKKIDMLISKTDLPSNFFVGSDQRSEHPKKIDSKFLYI
jgi:hypothetical protein